MDKEWVTIKEASETLNLCKTSVFNLVRRGLLERKYLWGTRKSAHISMESIRKLRAGELAEQAYENRRLPLPEKPVSSTPVAEDKKAPAQSKAGVQQKLKPSVSKSNDPEKQKGLDAIFAHFGLKK